MIVSELLGINSVCDDTTELTTEGLLHELLDVHERGEILAAEPMAFFADLQFAKIATVAARNFFACTIILPDTIFEESLGKLKLREASVGARFDRDWGVEQAMSVDDSQKRDLLLPDFDHGVVESRDVFRTLFKCGLFGDVLVHGAKITYN